MIKRILITGKNSYVGNKIADWLNREPEKYEVVKESIRNNKWEKLDFSTFDVVVHVAGIAHIKETEKNKKLYFDVNRDLTIKVALRAKRANVKQFVFLSSMSVYGKREGIINCDSKLEPKTAYGSSKLEAENAIKSLESDTFAISIIRPPMIYGENCKGNYQILSKFGKSIPFFPNFDNKRSMIYIDHLSEFIRLLIENMERGIYFPQNKEYVCTSNMVENILLVNNQQFHFTNFFNPLIKLMKLRVETFNKLFGNLYYDNEMSKYKTEYCKYSFEQTIKKTEVKS